MAYDGMYADLSTRGTTNEILTQVLEVQATILLSEDNVENLEAATVSNAALAAGAATTATTAAGNASASATNAQTAQNAAETARIAAQQAAADAITNSAAALVVANAANTKSDAAVATANGIDAKATTALSNSVSAVSTAGTANTNASTALTNANAAVVTANGVDAKAQTALDNSVTAVNTANTANTRNTDAITEGTTNLYFTQNRVRATAMTGLSTASNTAVVAADTNIVAIGKLQAQTNDRYTKAAAEAIMGSRGRSINYFDNASFVINQRGSFSLSGAAAGVYFFDRWKSTAASTTVTQGTTGSPEGANFLTVTGGQIGQVIPTIGLNGGTYVLSQAGTAPATVLRNGTAIATLAGAGQVSFTLDKVGLTSLEIRFGSGGTVLKPQLEFGTVATPFQPISYFEDLKRCQIWFARITSAGFNGMAPVNNTVCSQRYYWPERMVGTPLLVISIPSVVQSNCSGYGFDAPTPDGVRLLVTTGVANTAAAMDMSGADFVQGSCEP